MILKRDIVNVCHKLYEKGYVVADDGNVSVRISSGLYITQSGSYFSEIAESQVIQLDKKGNQLIREHIPSSELGMHLEVYKRRSDVSAIIHAHAPYSTAFSLQDDAALDCQLTEIKFSLGEIPIAPYADPGTEDVAVSIRKFISNHNAIILANHGILTVGKSLLEAYLNLERVEHFAKICYLAKTLKT